MAWHSSSVTGYSSSESKEQLLVQFCFFFPSQVVRLDGQQLLKDSASRQYLAIGRIGHLRKERPKLAHVSESVR